MRKNLLVILCVAVLSLAVFTVSECKADVLSDKSSGLKAEETFVKPNMVSKPIEWNTTRQELMREYARIHYGKEMESIVPQMIVLHWTAAPSWEGTYNYFYPAQGSYRGGGKLNVGSHYLVDKDGTIYELTPETALNRHIIGYNWCAIGIENVGGVNGKEDLTEAQVKANIALIKYLSQKYTSIKYVMGHYQQEKAKTTGLYLEKVSGYHSDKIDPGPKFMGAVHEALKDSQLVFFQE